MGTDRHRVYVCRCVVGEWQQNLCDGDFSLTLNCKLNNQFLQMSRLTIEVFLGTRRTIQKNLRGIA